MTNAVAKRAAHGVDYLSEGDWIVRGTQDPHEALVLIVEHADEEWAFDDLLAGVARPRPGIEPDDYELDPEAISAMADWCHTMLATARPGYYRKVHCLPSSWGDGEGWAWAMHYAEGPARGAFAGVYFRGW